MAAAKKIDHLTVDLSTCPNLVVIYLGMRMAACGGASEKKEFSCNSSPSGAGTRPILPARS
jgi:hypothetical protein